MVLDIENDDDYIALQDDIDEMLVEADQRLKKVILIVLFCGYKVRSNHVI